MPKPLEPIPHERMAIGCTIFLVVWVIVFFSFVIASLLKATLNA